MIFNIFQNLFLILFPALVLYLESKIKLVKLLSPIVICYLFGIIIANIPSLNLNKEILRNFSEISISLAIPLLLFNSNIMDWIRYAGKVLFSFIMCIAAVIISSSIFYFLFCHNLPQAWQVSGMLVGVYTGGTPNMSAIGVALETPEEIFILLNSSDVILGGIYFIFLISVGHRILGWFLPKFNEAYHKDSSDLPDESGKISRQKLILNILTVLLLGVGLLGLASWISILIKGEIAGPWVILIITSLGIAVSFIKRIQKMEGSYETAHYLLLIFSLAMGALADVNELMQKSTELFMYCGLVMTGSILIHYTLAAVFRIDRDTVMLTSTAAIYGPAFIGPVANAINNKKLIASGITMGLLGYAVGNYLGIGLAMLLH